MKLINKRLWKFTGLAAVDGLMFGFTNPRNVPSLGLIIGFLLLVATLYYLVNRLLSLAGLYGLVVKRRRRLAMIITGLISALLALQSMGGLSLFDVLVTVPLVIIMYVYSSYSKRPALALNDPLRDSY